MHENTYVRQIKIYGRQFTFSPLHFFMLVLIQAHIQIVRAPDFVTIPMVCVLSGLYGMGWTAIMERKAFPICTAAAVAAMIVSPPAYFAISQVYSFLRSLGFSDLNTLYFTIAIGLTPWLLEKNNNSYYL